MRVHGISDDISNMDDDNEDHTNYDWAPNSSKAMYTLCTNPNKLKSCRVCKNCSTEFSSWKSFLEHGKCITNETDSDVGDSFPGSDHEEGLPRGSYEHNWSKRKRSYRAKVGSIINPNFPSSEEENLALCLLMLSSGTSESFFVTGTKESCPSASKDGGRKHHLSPYNQSNNSSTQYHEKAKLVIPRRLFECKACKKVFSSHQALGGHRASHKKVKGCFAAKLDHTDENEEDQAHGMITQEKLYFTKLQDDNNGSYTVKKKAKLHECSICYRVFSSGQALGGHKRCHWITSKNSLDHASRSVVKFNNNQFYDQATGAVNDFPKDSETLDLTLDLNFHDLDAKPQNNQIYTAKEKVEKITEDETVTKTKFAKLIELKEMNSCETSSRWLQVGLGSTSSQAGSDP